MLKNMARAIYKWCTVTPYVPTVAGTLYHIETLLKTRPFVKVHGAAHGEEVEGTFYLVTKVDRRNERLAYFNPYSHSNMMIDWKDFSSITVDPVQEFDLKPNRELNALIWQIYRDNSPYKRGQKRRRLGYDWKGDAIYIERGLHVFVGDTETHDLWGNVAIFEVAALTLERGGDHKEAFSYYAGYGTYGLTIDIGEWEPDPRFIDYELQARTKMRVEYEAYKASPPFKEGQFIESPSHGYMIFVRYLDEDRTAMSVYPGDDIHGISKLMTFKPVQ